MISPTNRHPLSHLSVRFTTLSVHLSRAMRPNDGESLLVTCDSAPKAACLGPSAVQFSAFQHLFHMKYGIANLPCPLKIYCRPLSPLAQGKGARRCGCGLTPIPGPSPVPRDFLRPLAQGKGARRCGCGLTSIPGPSPVPRDFLRSLTQGKGARRRGRCKVPSLRQRGGDLGEGSAPRPLSPALPPLAQGKGARRRARCKVPSLRQRDRR